MKEDSSHFLKANDHWNLTECDETDKQYLADFIGESTLTFLSKQNIDLYVQKKNHPFFGDVTIFYFEHQGRTVELIHKGKYPNKIEVCYSFTNDFLSKDEKRYDAEGDLASFNESMQFIRFLMRFFSSFKKDAPLVFRTFDQKRRNLVDLFVKTAGLTNVEY
jgi:hypothetical protein